MRPTKLYILIFTIIVGIAAYFAYPIIKERYFEKSEKKEVEIKNEPEKPVQPNENNSFEQNNSQENSKTSNPSNETASTPEKSLMNISRKQCEAECVDFKDNSENFSYCNEVCGLNPLPTKPEGDCESLNGLKKDYCLKDLAVEKNDFSICEKITDGNIKTTCIGRITENIVDKNSPAL